MVFNLMKVRHQKGLRSGPDQGRIEGRGGARWTKKVPLLALAPWRLSQELAATFHTHPQGAFLEGGGLSESTYAKK